ncbi:DUF4942 domain-containing protein [Variovorax gossypii]
MNAVSRFAETEVVDESATFFAPVSSDLLDGLLGQYQAVRRNIESLGAALNGEAFGGAMHYFLAATREHGGGYRFVDALAATPAALKVLDATYWSKALALTDVLDCMPQARRTEWDKAILDNNTVPFTEESVRPTIRDLLASRQKFFAERIDGIFHGLSGAHATNEPQGFSKRMIIGRVVVDGSSNRRTAGLINDLRSVIATFMGRPGLKHYETGCLIDRICQRSEFGRWLTLDGGALRLRVYAGIGTAHLEVHPEMAYRLNGVLASLYPMAIPAEFRTRPPSRSKKFPLFEYPLPFAVLRVLDAGSVSQGKDGHSWSFSYGYGDEGKAGSAIRAEADQVLEALGGAPEKYGVRFDYDPRAVIFRVLAEGSIPDKVSTQFYASSERLARDAWDLLDVGDEDTFLEPSAGTGVLAAGLPRGRTTCVEISGLRCEVLRARGFETHQADFIEWAAATRATSKRFTRCLMNPPFSDGRALAHLLEAASLITGSGRLVAILPASMRGKELLEGWDGEWSHVYANEFAGTDVSVAIYAAQRPSS